MIEIGKDNRLKVAREVDFGVYLADDEGNEVLMPARYVSEDIRVGDTVDVFVYTDSEDRPVATTEVPYAKVGEFAFLQVTAVNRIGAFLDWGLPKDLLVPFSEQNAKMMQGGVYPVYVYLDHESRRVVASARLEKHLGNVYPDYKPGQEVECLVIQHTPIGYKVIVDNLHWGMIYHNEIFSPIEVEETVRAYVKNVRPDGKIDLTLSSSTGRRVHNLADRIIERVRAAGGSMPMSDKSSPEEIKAEFQCSKKDFKKALGALYKDHRITITDTGITIA